MEVRNCEVACCLQRCCSALTKQIWKRLTGNNSRIRKVSHLISSTCKENKNMSYQELRDLVSQIQLFKDKSVIKKEEDRQDLIDEICGIIKFEEFTQGKRVFRFGDYGDKFYIICKGTVTVHIPIKVNAETMESSPAKK